jgi:hypothetical protein
MEESDGARSEEVVDPPFSDLMRRWLDEGDRLSESGVTSPTGAAARAEVPFRQALSRLRTGVDRYRLFVLVGVGLLPLALFTATHRGAAEPAAVAASTASYAPVATDRAPSPPPAAQASPSVATSRIAGVPGVPGVPLEPAVAALKPRPAVRRSALAATKPPPHRPSPRRHRRPSVARRAR